MNPQNRQSSATLQTNDQPPAEGNLKGNEFHPDAPQPSYAGPLTWRGLDPQNPMVLRNQSGCFGAFGQAKKRRLQVNEQHVIHIAGRSKKEKTPFIPTWNCVGGILHPPSFEPFCGHPFFQTKKTVPRSVTKTKNPRIIHPNYFTSSDPHHDISKQPRSAQSPTFTHSHLPPHLTTSPHPSGRSASSRRPTAR